MGRFTPDMRLGRWQEALADVERVDAIITDPPYGARTHSGHDANMGRSVQTRMRTDARTGSVYACGASRRRAIGYGHWTAGDVHEFVAAWHPRCAGWFVAMTSHDLVAAWGDAFQEVGRYAFAPLPLVETGRSVRLSGDGPSSWTSWLMVARPRTAAFARWGTLPGAYVTGAGMRRRHMGGKPLNLMRAIVRDYSRPGDLVCDPCMGHGTTLRAALLEGRRSVGAEVDPETYRAAVGARLDASAPALPGLFAEVG